jgi:hypothetical protein
MRGIECQTLALALGNVKQRGNPATVAAITLDQWRGIQPDFDKLAILAGKAQFETLLRLHALPHRIHGGAHLLMIAGWPEHMRRPLPHQLFRGITQHFTECRFTRRISPSG